MVWIIPRVWFRASFRFRVMDKFRFYVRARVSVRRGLVLA